jgi:hypothetical protein
MERELVNNGKANLIGNHLSSVRRAERAHHRAV